MSFTLQASTGNVYFDTGIYPNIKLAGSANYTPQYVAPTVANTTDVKMQSLRIASGTFAPASNTPTDNDKAKLLVKAQKSFNAFIRKRDELLNCISCDRTLEQVMLTDGWKTGGAWDCGHYLTRGGFPELRFEELNAHKQCKTCNGGSNKYAKKTRLVSEAYRINLIEKIGIENVEWVEGPHDPAKYTVEDLKAIDKKYKAKLKV